MALDRLPSICSRLRIFISYSSEESELAEEIAQALKNAGHRVFYDKDSLPAAGDYNARIRTAMNAADRCIFLLTSKALASGKYVLTEIAFAKARWPSPKDRVFPVIVDPDLSPAQIPVYLRSVHAIAPRGDITAEVTAIIAQSRRLNRLCRGCIGVAAAALAAVAVYAGSGLIGGATPKIELLPIERVHFRPRSGPPLDARGAPLDLRLPGAPFDWINSPLTVTIIGVGYDRSDGGSASALLRREQVDLQVGEARHTLDWAYRVAFVDRPCASWLCVQEPMSPRNINRNETNPSRETMFMQQQGDPVTWREFIDRVLGDETLTRITVTLRSTIDVSSNGRSTPMALVARCVVDVGAGRSNFLKQQFKTGANPRPTFWEPHCVSE